MMKEILFSKKIYIYCPIKMKIGGGLLKYKMCVEDFTRTNLSLRLYRTTEPPERLKRFQIN